MTIELSGDYEIARRLTWLIAKIADRFGIPPTDDIGLLLAEAMHRPAMISPGEYEMLYRLHIAAPNQETTLAPR